MKDFFTPIEIVNSLSGIWEMSKTASFCEYLKDSCKYCTMDKPLFESVYLAQAEEGDIVNNILRSMILWWEVNDTGITEILAPDYYYIRDEPENIRGSYYIKPTIRFFHENDAILLSESYGPEILCRKSGILKRTEKGIDISAIKLLCTYNT